MEEIIKNLTALNTSLENKPALTSCSQRLKTNCTILRFLAQFVDFPQLVVSSCTMRFFYRSRVNSKLLQITQSMNDYKILRSPKARLTALSNKLLCTLEQSGNVVSLDASMITRNMIEFQKRLKDYRTSCPSNANKTVLFY